MSPAPDRPSALERPRPTRAPDPAPRGFGEGPVSAPAGRSTGPDATPAVQISNRIVALQKQYLGRGPENIRTHFSGDLVIVLMTGALTAVERTLSEAGRDEAVLSQRRTFQDVMADRFKAVVRDVTGREVVAMMSSNHVDPDLALESFVLAGTVEQDGAA